MRSSDYNQDENENSPRIRSSPTRTACRMSDLSPTRGSSNLKSGIHVSSSSSSLLDDIRPSVRKVSSTMPKRVSIIAARDTGNTDGTDITEYSSTSSISKVSNAPSFSSILEEKENSQRKHSATANFHQKRASLMIETDSKMVSDHILVATSPEDIKNCHQHISDNFEVPHRKGNDMFASETNSPLLEANRHQRKLSVQSANSIAPKRLSLIVPDEIAMNVRKPTLIADVAIHDDSSNTLPALVTFPSSLGKRLSFVEIIEPEIDKQKPLLNTETGDMQYLHEVPKGVISGIPLNAALQSIDHRSRRQSISSIRSSNRNQSFSSISSMDSSPVFGTRLAEKLDALDLKNNFVGTPDYLAPESILGTFQDKSVDWVFFNLQSGQLESLCMNFFTVFRRSMQKPPRRCLKILLNVTLTGKKMSSKYQCMLVI